MEAMVEDGYVQAVLDITPTEVADALYGGIFSAGAERLEAPGKGRHSSFDCARLCGHG